MRDDLTSRDARSMSRVGRRGVLHGVLLIAAAVVVVALARC